MRKYVYAIIFALLLTLPIFAQNKPLSDKDFVMGPFTLGKQYNEQDAKKIFGKIKTDSIHDNKSSRTIKFEKGMIITIKSNEAIVAISNESKALSTARGLRIGDTTHRLFELYDKPDTMEKDGEFIVVYDWDYGQKVLAVKTEKSIIVSIIMYWHNGQ